MMDALFPSSYLVKQIAEKISKHDESSKTLEQLSLQARKQEIQMSMAREEARVAQELAIAKRIELATEVEIEEFYDLSGEGSIGIQLQETTASAGISGSGKKVTKRIYKFTGFRTTELPNETTD